MFIRIRKIIILILVFLIFFSFLDLSLTFVYKKISYYFFSKQNYMTHHDVYHHELKKNYTGRGYNNEKIFTNKYGFIELPNKKLKSLKDYKNYIIIGDSFAQGAGVDYDKSFSGIISSKFNKKGFNIINLSTVSYSPSIYYTKLKYFIENYDLKFSKIIIFLDISDPYDELYRYKIKNDKVVNRKRETNPFITNNKEQIIYYLKKHYQIILLSFILFLI